MLREEMAQFRKDYDLHEHNGFDSSPAKVLLPQVFAPVSLLDTSVANSGFSSFSIRHNTGVIELAVAGNGEGLGSQQALFQLSDLTKYFGMFHDSGTTTIETNALPTADPGGTGVLWNDLGTVKIT